MGDFFSQSQLFIVGGQDVKHMLLPAAAATDRNGMDGVRVWPVSSTGIIACPPPVFVSTTEQQSFPSNK